MVAAVVTPVIGSAVIASAVIASAVIGSAVIVTANTATIIHSVFARLPVLILPHSCFLHVPKTAGSWVKQAIQAAGIPYESFSVGHNQHPGLQDCPAPHKFKFAFVRHPLNLYRSYWQYKMTYGWDANNLIDQRCRSENFQTFVATVVQQLPGIYSQSLHDFVGRPGHEINFVGKYENLVEDLVSALQQGGELFDAAAIRQLQPLNVSDKQAYPAVYTPELEAGVLAAEAEVIARFNY
jgi:hypothetical protein